MSRTESGQAACTRAEWMARLLGFGKESETDRYSFALRRVGDANGRARTATAHEPVPPAPSSDFAQGNLERLLRRRAQNDGKQKREGEGDDE